MKHVSTYLVAFLAGGLVFPLTSYADGARSQRSYRRHTVKIVPSKKMSLARGRQENATIHLNSSNLNQLRKIKGIGEKKADAILQYRMVHGDFKSVEAIAAVKGIGKARMKKIIKDNPGVIVL